MSEPTEISEIHHIPLAEIEVSGDNVRISKQTVALDELAASIAIHGLLQPVVLVGVLGNPPYQLISGQRRFLAHQKLGRSDIKAVFTGPLSRTEAIIRSLVENLQRVDLNFADTQIAVTELYKELGSEEEVRKRTGLSMRTIRDHLQIEAKASPEIKKKIIDGEISVMDVKRALRAAQDDIAKAEKLVDLIIQNGPPANVKRRLVTYGSSDERLTADEIFKEASKPHIEQKIMLTLDRHMQDSLMTAANSLEMDPSELAGRALEEWLTENGYLVTQ
ncbi:ParB/RepB/Spo0J family partition protein [Haloferula sargassicola]|uniref:Nucleoid occlusion protein n=1 Tax=Haloferula sargassicola TaxID=490096 RepID=A0ABP9UJA7_9BACT